MKITESPEVEERRRRATRAAIIRMHAAWHAVRGLTCKRLDCTHAWYPA